MPVYYKSVKKVRVENIMGLRRIIRCPLCKQPLSKISEFAAGYENQKCRNCKTQIVVNLKTGETAEITE